MQRFLSVAAIASLLLAGCSGGGLNGSSNPGIPNALPNATTAAAGSFSQAKPFNGPRNLANFTWGEELVRAAAVKGPAPFLYGSFHVLVHMRNARGLQRYAVEASTPGSAVYRHFLTPQQIADRFAASETDYKNAAHYFVQNGLRVGMWPQREVLTVSGTRAQLESAFGTKFATYQIDGQTFTAPSGTPHFSRPLPVDSVDLAHVVPHPYNIVNGAIRGYSPQEIGRGFDYTGAWETGYTGQGINLGIIGTGPISQKDVPFMAHIFGAPYAQVVQVNASPQPASPKNGHTGTGSVDPNPSGLAVAPPVTAPCSSTFPPNYNVCNPEDGEAQLDTEQTATLAPGATVLFYQAYNPSECVNPNTGTIDNPVSTKPFKCPAGDVVYPLIGIQILDDSLQQAIADNRADVITQSYGAGEPLQGSGYVNAQGTGIGQIEFASLTAEGTAVLASSGDTGAYECTRFVPTIVTPCVSYPSGDLNVTSVGGVNIPLSPSGQLTAEITAWSYNTFRGGDGSFGNNVGSGGGISTILKAPSWQTGLVPYGMTSPVTMRAQPDVSLDADPETGPATVEDAAFPGFTYVFASGGTSASSPEFAAMWSLVLQACKSTAKCGTATGAKSYRLGNPAPLLYAIYNGTGGLPKASVFYDVVEGNNGAHAPPPPGGKFLQGYKAGPGYDLVTGIGASFAGHLIQSITGNAVP